MMFPVFNSVGTMNYAKFVDTFNNYTIIVDDDGNLTKIQNEPLDNSDAQCTPCGKPMSEEDLSNCGKFYSLFSISLNV